MISPHILGQGLPGNCQEKFPQTELLDIKINPVDHCNIFDYDYNVLKFRTPDFHHCQDGKG